MSRKSNEGGDEHGVTVIYDTVSTSSNIGQDGGRGWGTHITVGQSHKHGAIDCRVTSKCAHVWLKSTALIAGNIVEGGVCCIEL